MQSYLNPLKNTFPLSDADILIYISHLTSFFFAFVSRRCMINVYRFRECMKIVGLRRRANTYVSLLNKARLSPALLMVSLYLLKIGAICSTITKRRERI